MLRVHAHQQTPEFGKDVKKRITNLTKKKEHMEARRAKQLWNIAKTLDEVMRDEMNVVRGKKSLSDHDGEIQVEFVRPNHMSEDGGDDEAGR